MLVMNNSKTSIVYFQNSNTVTLDIDLEHSTIISTSNSVKFLGLHLDENLNFKVHIDKLCKKLSAGLFALRTLKSRVHTSTLLVVFYALFQSHLTYGIILWGNCSDTSIVRVLRL
jgi:hypothetical protein